MDQRSLPPGRSPPAHSRRAADPSPSLRRASAPGCPVLVADRDADTRAILALALAHAGYACRTADTGAEALALAPLAHVVVAELYMPVAGHPCVVRPIVRARGPHGPLVLVYTAYASPRDVEWARSSGCDAWLVKPAPLPELLETIGRLAAAHADVS